MLVPAKRNVCDIVVVERYAMMVGLRAWVMVRLQRVAEP